MKTRLRKSHTRLELTDEERERILHLVTVEKRSIPYTSQQTGRSWGVVQRVVSESKEKKVTETGMFDVDLEYKNCFTI